MISHVTLWNWLQHLFQMHFKCQVLVELCHICNAVRTLLLGFKTINKLLHCIAYCPTIASGRFAGLLQGAPLSRFVICLECQQSPLLECVGDEFQCHTEEHVYRYFPLFHFIFWIYTGNSLRFQSPQEQVLCILVLLLWQLPHRHLRWHLTALAPRPAQSPASQSSRALMVWRQTAEA